MRGFVVAGLFCLLLLFISCDSAKELARIETTRFAMGTVIEFTVIHDTQAKALGALEAASKEIERIDKLFYEENKESPLFDFNHRDRDEVSLPAEVLDLIKDSIALSQSTDGAFDITIGGLLDLYGFDNDTPVPPSLEKLSELIPSIGSRFLSVNKVNGTLTAKPSQLSIALGGVAKGYAVDRAIAILRQHQVKGALVNAGGDLRVIPRSDGVSWFVGVQHPRVAGRLLRVLKVSSSAVATSGDYQKYYMSEGVRYHHLLDPRTGHPARVCRSTTVLAPTTKLADALATALFVLGPERGEEVLAKFPNCYALWILEKNQLVLSEGSSMFLKSK